MSAPTDQFLAAAEVIEGRYPDAARLLRAEVHSPPPEPHKLRRTVLRRLWNVHFFGMPRTAAAHAIAAEWRAFLPIEAPLTLVPGSMLHSFDRLRRAGVRPIAWRQIADDLDSDLDRAA